MLVKHLKDTGSNVDCIAFPDDGAAKRFSSMFQGLGFEIVTCGKTRGDGDKRLVTIQDGDCVGKNVVIVDDLVQTGGTLFECGLIKAAEPMRSAPTSHTASSPTRAGAAS